MNTTGRTILGLWLHLEHIFPSTNCIAVKEGDKTQKGPLYSNRPCTFSWHTWALTQYFASSFCYILENGPTSQEWSQRISNLICTLKWEEKTVLFKQTPQVKRLSNVTCLPSMSE